MKFAICYAVVGPAHTVIADNNVARGHIMSVLDDWDQYARRIGR